MSTHGYTPVIGVHISIRWLLSLKTTGPHLRLRISKPQTHLEARYIFAHLRQREISLYSQRSEDRTYYAATSAVRERKLQRYLGPKSNECLLFVLFRESEAMCLETRK